jgi:hypothetical protein
LNTDYLLIFVCLAVGIYFILGPSNKSTKDELLHFKLDILITKLGVDLDFNTELKNKIIDILNNQGEKEALDLYKKITGQSNRLSQRYLDTLLNNKNKRG